MNDFKCELLPKNIIDRMLGNSYPVSCSKEISLKDLRYLTIKYYDFNGNIHNNGEIIIHYKLSQDILDIFHTLYKMKYPIEKMNLIDNYHGDDELSMADNNTSAFNYRTVANQEYLSAHAYGMAIDINPLLNPYVVDNTYYPKNATAYLDRSKNFIGKIDETDLCYKLFTQLGWVWGGNWDKNSFDYQHFEKLVF